MFQRQTGMRLDSQSESPSGVRLCALIEVSPVEVASVLIGV